jgi:putative transcriptional regulator
VRRYPFAALLALIFGVTGRHEVGAADSAAGRLLVAHPSLEDSNFAKTVVLILRHGENGAFGLIINRFVDLRAPGEILALFSEEAPESDARVAVHIGGPVELDSTLVLHSPDYLMDRTDRLGDQFAVSPTVDTMIATVRGKGPAEMRIIFGYAGWGPGQLE